MNERSLHSRESSRRHDTSTVACLGAVCYDLGFDVTDHRVGLRTAPKTEVCIQVEGLAFNNRVFRLFHEPVMSLTNMV
jgi:hypothetical protein